MQEAFRKATGVSAGAVCSRRGEGSAAGKRTEQQEAISEIGFRGAAGRDAGPFEGSRVLGRRAWLGYRLDLLQLSCLSSQARCAWRFHRGLVSDRFDGVPAGVAGGRIVCPVLPSTVQANWSEYAVVKDSQD
eukprot:scaffold176891_cov18-Tisochrysis_lutea.AAC.2